MFLNIIAAKLGRRKVSDIEFMSIKQFLGKILKNHSNRTTTGVITSVTPATGKTFYLAKASSFAYSNPAGVNANQGDGDSVVQVRNDTNVNDVLGSGAIEVHASGVNQTGTGGISKTESSVGGDSLVGNGIKTYDLNLAVIGSDTTVYSTIFGYIENDADDPRI